MKTAGWAAGPRAWSRGDSGWSVPSIATRGMPGCRAGNMDLSEVSKCLNVGNKFRLFLQFCIFYSPPPGCHMSSDLCVVTLWHRGHWREVEPWKGGESLRVSLLGGREGRGWYRARPEGKWEVPENKLLLAQLAWRT